MMIKKAVTVLAACIFLAGPGIAVAADGTSPKDAALCKAALSLKSKDAGVLLRDSLEYVRAANWFDQVGARADQARYDQELISYDQAFRTARDKKDPQYDRAVRGCIDYYQSRTGG